MQKQIGKTSTKTKKHWPAKSEAAIRRYAGRKPAPRPKTLPLSVGELAAYTVLWTLAKALDRISENPDSFRSSHLFELVDTIRTCVRGIVREMETYERFPEDS